MEYHLREIVRERTEEWLCDAAMTGNLALLYDVIATDVSILDRVLVGSFKGKNPLHVAISTGNTEFALRLLEIKPNLAEVVDTKFGAALHVASAKGHIKIVKALVKVSPEMCLARDRDGNYPLHVAAIKGQVKVLKELVRTSPHRAQVKVEQGDTVLHLCVKYYQFPCLVLLLDMIPNPEFVNDVDSGGNTILHLAVFEKRLEMIKHVLSSGKMDVNAKNNSGQTALDIHLRSRGNPTGSEIQEILLNAGAKRSAQTIVHVGVEVEELEREQTTVEGGVEVEELEREQTIVEGGVEVEELEREQTIVEVEELEREQTIVEGGVEVEELECEQTIVQGGVEVEEREPKWLSKRRDTFMVVASLIAAMAFQVGVNPPGGVWQDDSDEHVAGKAVLAFTNPYAYYNIMVANTVGFLLSLSTILLLIYTLPEPQRDYRWTRASITWWTFMLLSHTYMSSVNGMTPKKGYHGWILTEAFICIHILWITVMTILLLRRILKVEEGSTISQMLRRLFAPPSIPLCFLPANELPMRNT
ncbi:ankyrin repeat-containing protein At5g02620-like [Rhododendron vialii]|uniref:ankyrin repeat-containing protein At5g02620-like n=1 Tax=Rhododendron vialii TaxID=182163 RepID=UPI00265FAE6C|nr:ankyrin repeat-containing protein At5g02620-like [Rhododendron vialii]